MGKDGDTYNVGQGIGVGRNVKMTNVNVNQVQGKEQIDLPALADQLAALRAEMKRRATEPEHDVAVGAIAAAEAEAKNGDAPSTMDKLAKAGQWALDLAVKIGTPIAVDAIRKASGL
jgi:flavin reductase (DIM6/NTAB) family NADH-FMN oxidoreductase RutF